MRENRVVYVVSDIDKALAFEWLSLALHSRFYLCFILIGKERSQLAAFLKKNSIKYYEICDPRYPSKFKKWWKVLTLLYNEKPKVIHTHLWQANLLGLSAAWLLRIKKRIYTRHHATVHYHEHPSGRRWDLLCNFLATDIIAISQNIKDILVNWDHAKEAKIKVIHHGFDFEYFRTVNFERVQTLRNKYNINSNISFPVIGVISRYMKWKGIQYIIPAFDSIRKNFPNAKLILANAHGEYENEIKNFLKKLPSTSYLEIKFENDLAALYQLFDVYVHVPIDAHVEAFGQTYVESLVGGIPSVFTLSGIAPEFIKHKYNAWVVDFRNSNQIADGINEILENGDLRRSLKSGGEESTLIFSIENHVSALEKLYTDLECIR